MVEWFRTLDFNSAAPCSNPALATSSAMLVHSQLVCLRPVGILTCYIQFIIYFKIFVSFIRPWLVEPCINKRYFISYFFQCALKSTPCIY